MSTAEELSQQWLDAKAREDQANADRIAIEDQIVAALGKKSEGSKTHKLTGYKVEITGVINRKMDWTSWGLVRDKIPEEMRPVRTKPELDDTGVKWLQENRPDLYQLLPIEVKPGKTGVKVTAVASQDGATQ